MASKMFKCPYCNKRKTRIDLIKHVDRVHADLLPAGFTATRIIFNSINYGDLDYNGNCVICKGPSDWDENKARYNRLCNNPACRKEFNRRAEENLLRTKGVRKMSQSLEGQEKMLANRHISGSYKFQDGSEKSYVGTYELKALEFLDKVMNCRSEDVQTPGPTMQYDYNGEPHWYISDIYYEPYNLIIEVKDGGDRPNTRSMPEYRAKQIAKEKHIVKNTNYNYLRLTNNDFSQLLAIFADLKLQLKNNITDRVININENMFAAMQSIMPTTGENDVYVINYLKKNDFSGESDFAVSESPTFESLIYRDSDGILKKGSYNILENTIYNVYKVRNVKDKFCSTITQSMNNFVEFGFIYESIFGEKLYTSDQIKFNILAEEVIDFYDGIRAETSI
ncbi:MAG: hypothetical protein NC548_34865, partial [Lachnospiraceae bacterium]|nr:hypothetical protein [Lachnospiraceae bacterium]